MQTVQVLFDPNGCSSCNVVLDILDKLSGEMKFEVERLDYTKEGNEELAMELGVTAFPGVIVEGDLLFTGHKSEEQIREKIASHLDTSSDEKQ